MIKIAVKVEGANVCLWDCAVQNIAPVLTVLIQPAKKKQQKQILSPKMQFPPHKLVCKYCTQKKKEIIIIMMINKKMKMRKKRNSADYLSLTMAHNVYILLRLTHTAF